MSNRIVSEIMNAPDAYLIVDAVQRALDEERKRRLKFYNDITGEQKVEFINGEIIIHSPAQKQHGRILFRLAHLIDIHVMHRQLGFVCGEKLMIALTRNDYEPDICFFRKEKADQTTDRQTLFPAPDFIVEVLSPSTQARDRGIKFDDYQAHGIEEYWIIDPEREQLEQYRLVNNQYENVLTSRSGTVHSYVIEGFQIPVRAIFDDDENLKAIQNL